MENQNSTQTSKTSEDGGMKNIQLHRAESMVNENREVLDQIKYENPPEPKVSTSSLVYSYVGGRAVSVCKCLKKFVPELIMFLFMASYVLRSVTNTNLIMDKVCMVHFGLQEELCGNLKRNETIKLKVERLTNNYQLAYSFLQMAPAALLSFFIGAWSDKYGRKPPMIVALVGIIADDFGSTLTAYFLRSRVEYYFISAAFTGFSGGFICVMMLLYSYATDITSTGKRTMKYAFMEVAFGVSMPLGGFVGGSIFKLAGYVPVFVTSMCGHIICLLLVVLFINETKGLENKDSLLKKIKNFWSCESMLSSFRITMKPRPNQGRKQLLLLIGGMSTIVFSGASLAGIMFLYVHRMYDWDNFTYSTISALYNTFGFVVILIVVPIIKKRNIAEPIFGFVGTISVILRTVSIGLAFEPWVFHVALVLGFLASLSSLAGRTKISKIVSKDDLGKVFSFMTTAEMFLPIVASALVSQVFNATLVIFPGLIFVALGLLCIFPALVFVWIARLPASTSDETDEDEKQENVQNGE